VFSTAANNQTSVDIHVLQGEREFAKDNKTLGTFELIGIPPAPRGVPQIEVTFDIDANGIVSVKAQDKGTGKSQGITITASSNLSEGDIDKAVKDAEKYAEEDRKRKELIDTKNNAENLVFTIEKFIKDSGDKLSEDDKKALEEAVADTKTKIVADDIEEIKKALEDLSKISDPIFTKLYQQEAANANANPNPDGNADGANGDTIYDEPEIK
jgi:molecular chaperone DnaK